MPKNYLSSKYALIGDNLDLKQNVNLEVDDKGIISNISYDDVYDLKVSLKEQDTILIPGFINSHTHIGDSIAKEMGFNLSLKKVVATPNGLKHNLLESINFKTKIIGIKNAVMEMLSNGITCFMDFRERYLEGIKLLKNALIDSPIFYYIYGRFNDLISIEEIFGNADGIGLATYKNITPENKEILRECKKKFNKLIACHIAEKLRDENLIYEMIEDNLVDVVIHGTHFIKEDLKILKKRNIKLILCPRCNGYFGVGFPPIKEILEEKIRISLGTDNVMANDTDLFEEIRYLYRVSNILNPDIRIEARDLLKMVTIDAARNFNLDKEMGSIEKSKLANFFILDLNAPNYYTMDIQESLLYPLIVQRTKPHNIKKTYIKGEIVFERI